MGVTAEVLGRAGVPDATAVAAAIEPLAAWLAPVPPETVAEGLSTAGDPAAAVHALGRLVEAAPVPADPRTIVPLLGILGGSVTLGQALVAEGSSWPALLATALAVGARDVAAQRAALVAAGVTGPLGRAELQAELRRHHRRELVRIGGRDLLGLATVDDTVRELSALAEAAIDTAVLCTRARLALEWGDAPADFVVLGMGKLGGGELNYSSDIDLVYVYGHEGEYGAGRTIREFCCRLGEEVTRALAEVTAEGFCFRVDLRLRPAGEQGLVAASLPAALAYFEAWGQTWERAAWLKARPVGGDRGLGTVLLAELEPFIYRRYLDYGTVEDLKTMKRKVDASLRGPTARDRDVKLGRGGIREVEFFVQAQQLVHAGKDARLRERGTLATLARLAESGYVEPAQAQVLAAAYRFLRDVEHKLQIVQQRQTQLIPSDADAERALARRMGFRGGDGVEVFWGAHARHTGAVRAAFDGLFHGAEAERRRDEQVELTTLVDELEHEEQALWRLSQLGFADLEAAYQDLRLLRDGPPHAPASPRRRQALERLAPNLVGEIARSAAPDRALHHTATFISTVGARTSYLHLLLENPGVMRLLVRLFATSEFLSRFFLRHPELLDSLVRADQVRVFRAPEELEAELGARLAAAPDLETRLDDLRRFRHEEFLRIGVHDVEAEMPVAAVGRQLTAVAEACVRAAIGIARQEVLARTGLPPEAPVDGLAIVAMGKLGGAELNYNSDLDVIFVYDPGERGWWSARADPHAFFTRVAQRTISALQTPTREGIAYKIDTRLRPSGNQGPLVSSLESFVAYHQEGAAIWERQALIKARVVSGPPALRAAVDDAIARFVYGPGLSPAEAAEIARMRERIELERGGPADARVNIKTGRGGLVDVEFVVQMLQLRHGGTIAAVRARETTAAIAALAEAGVLGPDDARTLADGYGFLRALENRLRIEQDQPAEYLDTAPETLGALAHRLGYAGPDAAERLRVEHVAVGEAIRATFDRLVGQLTTGS
ncbi:MAG: bifunctional [glutamate--ammonia ligase]-adenylyl-L-tyrosine phosphorylase/[glutamate--ammonia-ligase] adenylyltransferase [Candidatus Binatia bacterium]